MERTALKVLLRQRHLQEHRAFCREYDRVARGIDRELVGTYPSKATFYRWLAGDLRGLPHPGHCRILEMMIPGWTATAMFEPWEEEVEEESGHDEAKAPTDSDWDVRQADFRRRDCRLYQSQRIRS